jgi:hypothetical protein
LIRLSAWNTLGAARILRPSFFEMLHAQRSFGGISQPATVECFGSEETFQILRELHHDLPFSGKPLLFARRSGRSAVSFSKMRIF